MSSLVNEADFDDQRRVERVELVEDDGSERPPLVNANCFDCGPRRR